MEPFWRSETFHGTLGEVRDGSRDALEGPGRVEGPSRWSGTGRWTLSEVRDGSRGLSGRSEMGRGTLEEVQDGSKDPRGDPGQVE